MTLVLSAHRMYEVQGDLYAQVQAKTQTLHQLGHDLHVVGVELLAMREGMEVRCIFARTNV